ncbi:hypothetical protein Ciccas_014417, partial [Cichlidogyrus casuarinus]
ISTSVSIGMTTDVTQSVPIAQTISDRIAARANDHSGELDLLISISRGRVSVGSLFEFIKCLSCLSVAIAVLSMCVIGAIVVGTLLMYAILVICIRRKWLLCQKGWVAALFYKLFTTLGARQTQNSELDKSMLHSTESEDDF